MTWYNMKSLMVALLLICTACVPQPDLKVGEYKLHTTIIIQEDWCYMGDVRANGVMTYYNEIPSTSTICISKKSDDIRRTLNHELEHAWLHATGNNPKLYNP